MDSRLASFVLVVLVLTPAVPATGGQTTTGTDPVPAVVAYLGGGINPYHEAFRAPGATEHPSTYIPGYPQEAQPFPITLDASSFEEAWEADEALWDSIVPMQLYYIPGTKIVGAISVVNSQNQSTAMFYGPPGSSHNTQTADAGAGNKNGIAPESRIVIATGTGYAFSARWVSEQAWIDILSFSFGCIAMVVGVPTSVQSDVEVLGWEPDVPSSAAATYQIAAAGRMTVSAAGNGPGTNVACEPNGPPWQMSVGAISGNGTSQYPYFQQTAQWRPSEISAHNQGTFATVDSLDGEQWVSGTSFAAPRIAGYAARLIMEARELLGDKQGFRNGAFATAAPGVALPPQGPLADGQLNLSDLEDLLRQNAANFPLADEWRNDIEIPGELAYPLKGYGGFMDPSYQQARQVLRGEVASPNRPWDDAWHDATDKALGAFWNYSGCRSNSSDGIGLACGPDSDP